MTRRLLSLLGLAPQPAPEKPKRTRKHARKDWRDEAVKRAAERHEKPFQCGPHGVPREVLCGAESLRTIVVVDQPQPVPQTVTVTALPRKVSK